MPQSAGHAVRRRDERLSRTRRVSLWVAGGAAAASLGLGTAFAQALPGHRAAASGAQPASSGQGQGGTSQGGTSQGQGGSGQPTASPSAAPARHHHHSLAPPQQPPATTQAPPQTTSGGS
jgi:hypothetical protein